MVLWDTLQLSKPRLRIVPCWNSGTCQTPKLQCLQIEEPSHVTDLFVMKSKV